MAKWTSLASNGPTQQVSEALAGTPKSYNTMKAYRGRRGRVSVYLTSTLWAPLAVHSTPTPPGQRTKQRGKQLTDRPT